MSATRIGLMGFGRIGRNLFRQLVDHPSLEIVAIADIADPEALAYLLKYDSIYGRFPKPIELDRTTLVMGDRRIEFLDTKEPGDVDWSAHGVEIVVQAAGSTSRFRTSDWCKKHIDAGASRVVLASTPEHPGDIPILLRGVNDEILTDDTKVVSLGSNTANAIAPVLRIIDDAFGIERAFTTTVHAFSNTDRLADVPTEGFRSSRAAGQNIIPAETNSPQILEQVMPEFAGKISGIVLNVPVPDGSTVDMVLETTNEGSAEDVNQAVADAIAGEFKGILEYSSDPIVSSDIVGSPASGVYDSLATTSMDNTLTKVIVWFDNGWGYTARVAETLEIMSQGASA